MQGITEIHKNIVSRKFGATLYQPTIFIVFAVQSSQLINILFHHNVLGSDPPKICAIQQLSHYIAITYL